MRRGLRLRDMVTVRERGLGMLIGIQLAKGDQPARYRVQLLAGPRSEPRGRVVLVTRDELED